MFLISFRGFFLKEWITNNGFCIWLTLGVSRAVIVLVGLETLDRWNDFWCILSKGRFRQQVPLTMSWFKRIFWVQQLNSYNERAELLISE